MNLRKIKKLKGITLVETLVYLVLFGLIFTSIMQYIFTVGDNNQKADFRKELEKETILINQHINDTFLQGTYIEAANTAFINNNGKIRVVNAIGQTIDYYLNNNRLIVNRNGITSYLTGQDFYVNKFYIEQIQKTGSSTVTGAKITFEIWAIKMTSAKNSFTSSFSLK